MRLIMAPALSSNGLILEPRINSASHDPMPRLSSHVHRKSSAATTVESTQGTITMTCIASERFRVRRSSQIAIGRARTTVSTTVPVTNTAVRASNGTVEEVKTASCQFCRPANPATVASRRSKRL